MQRRKTKQSKRRGQNPRAGGALIPHPPQLSNLGLKREVRMRFLTNAGFTGSVTYADLLDIFNVAASATTAFQLFASVRIKAVEVWVNALANASVTATVIFDGATAGSVGDQKLHTDSSMGIEPAHVRAAPVPLSLAAMYQPSSAAVAFFISIPAGAIIDVSLSLRNPLLGYVAAVQAPPVGAVAGTLYVRGLDGVAKAASVFVPQGVLSID